MKKFICVLSIVLAVVCVVTLIPAFSADTGFVVEDGVLLEYTGNSATVTIPSSVNVISDEAFAFNTTIKSLKLHAQVCSIGNEAFYGCTALESVSGSSGVKYVGALAFADTPYLNNSADEFLVLGSALVYYNGSSSSVTLPDSVTTISPYAFLRNDKLTTFTAKGQLEIIGEGAFYECGKLKTVSVTKSLTYIGADAFKGTSWLNSQGNFAILGDGVLVSYKGNSSAVTVPNTVRSIAPNAFYENSGIVSVTLPSSVYRIGERAFMSCSKLSSVELDRGLIMIDNEAFANCSKLEEIKTPLTLSKIGEGAFLNCSKLKRAFIAGSNLDIGYGAFAYCNSMEVALLSEGVSSIGEQAFSNNSNLKSVSVPSGVVSVFRNSFENSPSVTVVCDKKSFADNTLSSSVELSYNRGDCNVDGDIDIIDATRIQFYVASLSTYPDANLAYMDADFDSDVSILDATYVQLFIAQLL